MYSKPWEYIMYLTYEYTSILDHHNDTDEISVSKGVYIYLQTYNGSHSVTIMIARHDAY